MANNNEFSYNYSAEQNREIKNIRSRYLPQEENKLEKLKKLDRKVRGSGKALSICIGTIGAIVFGVGLCFGLGALAGVWWFKYLFGILGIVIMLTSYPIYHGVSKKTKEKLAPEIIRLSDEIMKENDR